ncbi:hypothetical protein [Parapedobacter lycopersici]|uniref:hypothetical protein n=1 Tax=Parapedobacter lycopersici TaxID=1864939 RepID=UPI00214D483E|nr:hypothetical protein [Parapedobacter lycopersici]
MSTLVKQPTAVACLFIWIGIVCGISFLEAWLKFRAPGVTMPIGLGIGRLVFNALNKVEWVLAAIVVVTAVMHTNTLFSARNAFLLLAVIILILQTAWLLPTLDARAQLVIENKPLPPSNLHYLFIGAEVLKIAGLFAAAIGHFEKIT